MKLVIIYDIEGYAYERRAHGIMQHRPAGVSAKAVMMGNQNRHDIWKDADLVFLLDYANATRIDDEMRAGGITCPLVVSFNAGPQRRRGMWQRVYDAADWVICNSQATYDEWPNYPHRCCISNGVDTEIFKPTKPIADRPDKCLWYGRASKAWKGYRTILDPLSRLLDQHGFRFDFRQIGDTHKIMGTDELVEWYNSGAYILCASDVGYEGTPNLITEAVACGCVAVSTRSGNILEWGTDQINCVLSDSNALAMLDGLFYARKLRTHIALNGLQTMQAWDWKHRAPYFFALFRKLVALGLDSMAPFSYRGVLPEEI